MAFAIEVILYAHIFIIIVCVLFYIIEFFSGIGWVVNRLILPNKSDKVIRVQSEFYSLVYFFINLIFIIGYAHINDSAPQNYRFWHWLILIIPLSFAFRKFIEFIQHKFN